MDFSGSGSLGVQSAIMLSLTLANRASNEPPRSLKLYNHKKAPIRAFSWLKASVTIALTFKNLLDTILNRR